MAAKKGRPVTNHSPEAAKRRARQKKAYDSMSKAERQAKVQRRSKEAQRQADERRDAHKDPARQKAHNATVKRENKAHPEKVAAREAKPTKPAGQKCTYPGCDRPATEWHHTSYNPPRGTWRCSRHNPRGGAA